MGYTLDQFYNFKWPEFFIYKEAYEINKWEEDYKFRLSYVQFHNSVVKRADQIKIEEVLPSPLDKKFLKSDNSDSLTLKEAIKMAQIDGQHVGRCGA